MAIGALQVLLNSIRFEGQIADFSRTGKNFKESTSSVSYPSQCQGLVLTDWVDRVRDVGDLISLYKQLIEKDVESLRETKRAIEDADKDRARNILEKVSGVMDSVNDVIRKTHQHTGTNHPENIRASDAVKAAERVISSHPGNQWTTIKPPIPGTPVVGSAVTGVVRATEVGSVVSSVGTITGTPAIRGAAAGFVSGGTVGGYLSNATVGAATGFIGNNYNFIFGNKGNGGGGGRSF